MKRIQAIKILRKCVDYYIKNRLAFNANLYEQGISKDPFTEKCFDEREKIEEAFKVLHET